MLETPTPIGVVYFTDFRESVTLVDISIDLVYTIYQKRYTGRI